MCGFVGLFNPQGLKNLQQIQSQIESATESLHHRGPDARETVVWPSEGLVMGHCRLSILDLDRRANQPMASKDQSVLLSYNGEIYNFRSLKKDLQALGSQFQTEGDTEVLIEGYQKWGMDNLLKRLAGMFSFALFDKKEKVLFLVRDRAGKKPHFFSHTGNSLVFGSEIKSLAPLLPNSFQINPEGLGAYLHLKFVPWPETLFKNINKVPPASYLKIDRNLKISSHRYWHPWLHKNKSHPSGESTTAMLEGAFMESVKRRLVSDVPVCLFLSGGLDSSLIAAALKKIGTNPLTAYSIGYKDLPGFNELSYSKLVAEKFSLDYREIILEQKKALEILEDSTLSLDEPISDWIWVPLYQLSQQARKDGFKVTLLGEGSDEIFFGYDSMMKGLKTLNRYQNPLWQMMGKAAAAVGAPIYRHAKTGHRRYDFFRRLLEDEPLYLGSSLGFNISQQHQIAGENLKNQTSSLGTAHVEHLYQEYKDWADDPEDNVNLICYVEFYTKMNEVLLQRVDRITMLNSLEARAPFLDHELVEKAFSIPGSDKIEGQRLKSALKELAAQYLPPEIINRKKMGFSFPFQEWLKGELGSYVESKFESTRLFKDGWVNGEFARTLLKEHRAGKRDNAPKIWMLFDLARWYDQWIPS